MWYDQVWAQSFANLSLWFSKCGTAIESISQSSVGLRDEDSEKAAWVVEWLSFVCHHGHYRNQSYDKFEQNGMHLCFKKSPRKNFDRGLVYIFLIFIKISSEKSNLGAQKVCFNY